MDITEILTECSSLSDLARAIFGKENYTNREKSKKLLEENGVDWQKWLEEKKEKPKRYCLFCGKEIIEGDYRKKFCNHSCAASYNNQIVIRSHGEEKACLNCGKILEGHQKKFCSNTCQREYEYKQNVEKWKNGEDAGWTGHSAGIKPFIKRYLFEKYECKCQKCGWGEKNPVTETVPLQIHHVDGDCKNNKEENLELLCPNCHSLTETFGRLNKKSARKR